MAIPREVRTKLNETFRPHAPIEQKEEFHGRVQEREKVESAIVTPGLQVIIYGEHGAGKTSLANVATSEHPRVQIFCQRADSFASICKNIAVQYQKANPVGLVYDAQTGTIRFKGSTYNVSSLTGNDLRSLLPDSAPLCVILDELDRVDHASVIAELAELCKNLSTYQQNITMVMIGVAENAEQLLRGHASNIRNLRQVHLGRMSNDELKYILRRGETVLDLKFDHTVEENILSICDSFPYYLHLVAINAAWSALDRGSKTVELADYNTALRAAAQDCEESLRTAYQTAILSLKNSQIYRQIIWSLAAMENSVATVRDIAVATNKLAESERSPQFSIQSIGQAVARLTGAIKKNVLTSRDKGFYGFSNPLMRAYVRLERYGHVSS